MSRLRHRHARPLALALIALASAALAGTLYATDLLRGTELDSMDARFDLRGPTGAPDDIVLVTVDDTTFNDLRRRWPFPRSLHARVIERLTAAGASVIAYDVQFTERTRPREDAALIDAVDHARGVVLATTEVDDRGETGVLGGEPTLREIGARAANALLEPDAGGSLRRVEYSVEGLESFAVAVAEEARGEQIEPSGFGSAGAWIDYHGPPGTFPEIPFSRVLRGRFDPGAVRGKVVVVGASAPSLKDVHATPTADDELMSGPEVQANAISTVRRGLPLSSLPPALDLLLIGLLAAVPAIALRRSLLALVLVSLGAAAGYAAAAQVAFAQGVVAPVSYPLLALALSTVGGIGWGYIVSSHERQRTRDIFARFVPAEVVDEVLACADDDLRLAPVRRRCSVLFSDIRGFTSLAEAMPPDQVIELLNRYLEEVTEAILGHGGTLTAYIGDGVMAIFGAPLQQDDHADRALAAAREVLEVRLPRFNAWLRSEAIGDDMRIGIGVNSGFLMAGNIGSRTRLEYTAIGDTVNAAARLESMTKGTPHQLFLADSTRRMLRHGEPPDLKFVGELAVRGRREPIKTWTLAALPDEALTAAEASVAAPPGRQ